MIRLRLIDHSTLTEYTSRLALFRDQNGRSAKSLRRDILIAAPDLPYPPWGFGTLDVAQVDRRHQRRLRRQSVGQTEESAEPMIGRSSR